MHRKPRTYLIGLALLAVACGPDGDRGAELRSNPEWTAPEAVDTGDVRLVSNAGPKSKLTAADAEAPVGGTWLLFWGDQAAAHALQVHLAHCRLTDQRFSCAATTAPVHGSGLTAEHCRRTI